MTSGVLDDVFKLLSIAGDIEKQNRIEAATKYYEAVHLMKRYLERGVPETQGQDDVRNLLLEKIRHYEQVASSLINDESSVQNNQSILNNLRSPVVSCERFNNERSSNWTVDGVSCLTDDSVLVNVTASQANAKLAHALDLDEVGNVEASIAAYMDASEIFLSAIKAAEKLLKQGNTRIDTLIHVLKRRLLQTLDRVETLKQMKNNRVSRVVQQERNKLVPNPQGNESASIASPQSHLSAEEISVLKTSSLIASGLFLPWSDSDAHQLLNEALVAVKNPSQAKLFTDPNGFLPLSPKQKERFSRWARPSEIAVIRQKTRVANCLQTPIVVRSITPYTIRQQYVTDCSFIASLCICAAFERRFGKKLITSILHPQTEAGVSIYNPQGKYLVKLWLNGVARAVVIDDYLPIDKHGNLLCSCNSLKSNENKSEKLSYLELWVCLIEKAYMKLCGGYDFPGSNSGVDLFSLTGWIPERIMFAKDQNKVKDFETHPERAFERILSASSFGDCLITVSTDLKLTEAEADAIGLVTGHAYAVLDVIQTRSGMRLLQLKNPWAHKSWKGRFSCHDKEGWKDRSFRQEVGYDPEAAMKQDDGIFWVCWDDVLKFFHNFHLSWNPWLFRYRFVTHGYWPLGQGPIDDTFSVGDNPQYVMSFSKEALQKKPTIWLLISRHVTKQEQEGAEPNDYLTLHLHRNKGRFEKIWYPGKSGDCVLTGIYTNNPHVLVRYDIEGPEDAYLTAVLSQYKKSNDLGYTLSCYCTEEFSLGKPQTDLKHTKSINSGWTTSLSGGPLGRSTFRFNPMFALWVPEDGTILQMAATTSTTSAVNIICFAVTNFGQGFDHSFGDPLLDSGNYRHGFVVTRRKKLNKGPYVIVVSNFHKDEVASFLLKIMSSIKVQVEVIK